METPLSLEFVQLDSDISTLFAQKLTSIDPVLRSSGRLQAAVHCTAHSGVMGGLYRDKRKYAVSDRDSNPVFLFLLYFLKKLLNDLT